MGVGSLFLFRYFMNQVQQEYDRRENPNIFVPSIFYRARADSYRYWGLARLAHGSRAYFSYFFYDTSTVAVLQAGLRFLRR